MYPQSSNDVKETGIPMDLQVHREQATTHTGASVYLCKHEKCADTAYFAQNPASLYSHMRRKHLGIVLACPYCPNKVYWNSCGWKDHMTSHHCNVPHYGHTLMDEAREAHKMFSNLETKEQMNVPFDPLPLFLSLQQNFLKILPWTPPPVSPVKRKSLCVI